MLEVLIFRALGPLVFWKVTIIWWRYLVNGQAHCREWEEKNSATEIMRENMWMFCLLKNEMFYFARIVCLDAVLGNNTRSYQVSFIHFPLQYHLTKWPHDLRDNRGGKTENTTRLLKSPVLESLPPYTLESTNPPSISVILLLQNAAWKKSCLTQVSAKLSALALFPP